MSATILEHREHDHARCAHDAIARAEAVCAAEGLRLTRQRRSVLEALLASHIPASAYDVVERLSENGRGPAPISVYRALDFLVEHGFAHRIESASAYIGCSRGPGCAGSATAFLICERCRVAGEIESEALGTVLSDITSRARFEAHAPVVEVKGLCERCRLAA